MYIQLVCYDRKNRLMNKELINEIDALMFTCYQRTFTNGMRGMIDEYYGKEDFYQDVRIKMFREITVKETVGDNKLSTIVFNQMRWHYNELFSNYVRKSDKYNFTCPDGKLQRTQMHLKYLGSTLASDDEENLLESRLASLAGTFEPDFDTGILVGEILHLLHNTDIIPDDKYKSAIIEMICNGESARKDVADRFGCSASNISQKVRKYRAKLLERLNNLGYNIDQDLVVYT